jgi:27-O-demethylrifamycin SV methyltransferase
VANGLPDSEVDRGWALASSHLMVHKDRLASECARVLRPGRRLVLCDLILPRELTVTEVMRYADAAGGLAAQPAMHFFLAASR